MMSGSPMEDLETCKFAGIPPAAIALETVRPTPQDIECLATQLPEQKGLRFRSRQAPKANAQVGVATHHTPVTSPTEKHGYWPPLLAAALGSRIQLPDKLKPLHAFSAVDSEDFARLLAAVRKHDGFSDCNGNLKRPSSWELLRSPTLLRSTAPVHAALLAIGATEAAANARAEVQRHAFQMVNMGRFGDKKLPCVRDLARLQWFGADWMATDSLKRTALHILCASTGHKFMSSVLHTSTAAALARFLCAQAPRALLLEDAEGLTPLNYLVAPFRASIGCVGSVHRELLLAVIEGLLSCRIAEPVALAIGLRGSIALNYAVQSTAELAAQHLSNVNALTGWAALAGGCSAGAGAWECALMQFHLGLWRARDLFHVSGDLRIRAYTLRRISGSACADKTVLSEAVAKQQLLDIHSTWTVKHKEYEERLSQLDAELGRVESEQNAGEIDEIDNLHKKVHLRSSVGDCFTVAAPSQMSGIYTLSAEALSPEHATNNTVLAKSSAVCEAEEVVARVRNARLVDVDLEGMSDDARRGVASVRASLSAAVQRLAQDLYELECHFVMELVQNADDNRYPDTAAEPPTLRMGLHIAQEHDDDSTQSAFFFSANNENGLRTEDVVAMCDINASSKRNQPGCTGHKGIGWKSTFAVSDCPFVLSGACTFKFDTAGPLGQLAYVTPTWVSPEELSQLPAIVQEAHARGSTVIYLPLRTAAAAAAVAEGFRQLEQHAVSLLFFRRLRRLQLEYPSGRQVLLEHLDRGAVAFKEHTPGNDQPQVLLHKYVLHQEAVVLPGGHTGNLTLAFPLPPPPPGTCSNADHIVGDREQGLAENSTKEAVENCHVEGLTFTPSESKEQLRPQALYVGLPVRLTGFCFAIDGPFDLTASRSELHEGSAVNTALCDAVPVVFAAALQEHAEVIGPRALQLIGDLPAEGHWRSVRRQLLVVLNSISCIPTEDGELALPGECVERPQSPSPAEAASQLIPPELLLLSCGKRFARSTRAAGSVRGVTVAPLGFNEWLHVLRYRGALWPYGLVGAALREGCAESFFRTIYTWIDEEIRLAECASTVLQQIWDLELFPSAAPGHTLLRLADGPIFECFFDKLSEKWQRTLCANGVLHVLEPSVRAALDGYPGSSFLSEVATVKPTLQAIASICVEWHALRFGCAGLEAANAEAIWASLACLVEVFLAEETLAPDSYAYLPLTQLEAGAKPGAPDSFAYLPLTQLEVGAKPGERIQWWRELGNVLWIPTLGGVDRSTPPVARASELICASYLGVPGAPEQDVKRGSWGEQTRSLLCNGSSSQEDQKMKLHCCVAYDYCRLGSGLGQPMRWETFFDALGIRALRPSLNGINCAVSGNLMNKLGACLLSEEWWVQVMKEPPMLQYVCCRVQSASQEELAWLQALPVYADGDALPRCVSGHFLYDTFVQVGGGSLPYVRLAPVTDSSREALHQARSALERLGVQTTISAQSLLRCLSVLREDGFCKDAEVYADFYKEIASLDVSAWGEGDMLRVRETLADLVFVPDRGFMRAVDCTWEDEGIMQWLTEVPSLRANYERYGPTLRHFFLGVVETPACLDGFAPRVFLQALRKLIQQVDIAHQNREAMLSGAPISAKSLIEDLGAVVMQVYGRLVRTCEGASVAEHSFLRNTFANERLLLLVNSEHQHLKRLSVAEAWWDVEAELVDTKVAELSIRKHYGQLPGAEAFFLRVLGLRRCCTRSDLVQRAKLPMRDPGPLSHWDDGLSVSDLESFTAVQTTDDFWNPSNLRNRGDEEEERQQNENDNRHGPDSDSRSSQQFHPPPAANGSRHPPAWRSRESLQRQQEAEEARQAEDDRSERLRRQAREQWQRENPTFMVNRQTARTGGENPDASRTVDSSERSATTSRNSAAASQGAGRQQPAAASQRSARQQDEQHRDAAEEEPTEQEYLSRVQARIDRAREARAEARARERMERQRQSAERRRAWERYRGAEVLRRAEQQEEAEEGHPEEDQNPTSDHRPGWRQRMAEERSNLARARDCEHTEDRDAADAESGVCGTPMQSDRDAHGATHSEPQAGHPDDSLEVQTMESCTPADDEEDHAAAAAGDVPYEEVQLIEFQILQLEREVVETQSHVETLMQEKAGVDQACEQYVRLIQNFWEQSLQEEFE